MMQRNDETGSTALEYALIVVLCVLAFAGSVQALRLALGLLFGSIESSFD